MSEFPSLSEVSHVKTKKGGGKTGLVVPPPVREKDCGGKTPFVWAGVVDGKNIDLSEKEKADEAEREMEEAKKVAAKKERLREEKEQLLRAQEQARLYAEEKKEQLVRVAEWEKKHSRENGYMDWYIQTFPEGNVWQVIPEKVNEKSVRFIQLWLSNWKEHLKAESVEELRECFYKAFIPWVLQIHSRFTYEFEEWERTRFGGDVSHEAAAIRYSHMHAWAKYEKSRYDSGKYWEYANRGHAIPPWANHFWLEVTHTTWENCLVAMDENSGTFEGGLFKIGGACKKSGSRSIIWNEKHKSAEGGYISTHFYEKSKTPAQQKRSDDKRAARIAKAMRGEFNDELC